MTATELGRRIVFVAANPSIDRLVEVERIALGAIHRPDRVVAFPGGKGLNATRAAAALGGRVTAVALVAGRAGDWITERLAALGIDVSLVHKDGETRTCLSVLDRSTGLLTEFYEAGEPVRSATWAAFEAAVTRELDRGDVGAVAFCGSLPPGSPRDGYARIARHAHRRSVPTIIDAYGPVLEAALAQPLTVVKLNALEATEATGSMVVDAGSAAAAARALRERGADGVVITLGVAGAVAVTATATWRLVPPDARGAYPVGSGDAFVGGLAVALVDGESLVGAARYGMAAGIANALMPGAGELDPALAGRLLARVEVAPF